MLIMEIICMCFDNHDNTGNVRLNVTLRRVRAAIVAGEKQYVLHILSVCL